LSDDSLLRITDLAVDFPTRRGTVHAVTGASLSVAPGETLGLVGESGSGKSVTALSIVDLVPPPGMLVGGRIWFDGQDVTSSGGDHRGTLRGREIAVIFQDPAAYLNPVRSIGDQVTEPMIAHQSMSGRAARIRAIELLERVGIADPESRLRMFPHQFSGGMRQRVMIAMALACRPRLLIADEPTTALDVTVQAQIVQLLLDLKDELGMAVILITHDVGLVAGLVDRVSVMYGGRIVEDGDVYDIFRGPAHPYTRGLLGSVPRLDRDITELVAIPGSPRDVLGDQAGCPFVDRCSDAMAMCSTQAPPRVAIGEGHHASCWLLDMASAPAAVARS